METATVKAGEVEDFPVVEGKGGVGSKYCEPDGTSVPPSPPLSKTPGGKLKSGAKKDTEELVTLQLQEELAAMQLQFQKEVLAFGFFI